MMLIIFLRSVCCFCDAFFDLDGICGLSTFPIELEEGYLFTGVILKKLMVRVEDYFAS